MPAIRKPLSQEDLERVRTFLAPEPEGRSFFDNFVIENKLGEAWGVLGPGGKLRGETKARRLFDLWQLLATVLPEAAGTNRNHILFDLSEPISDELLAPDSIQIPRSIFYEIADQLAGVVRSLDARIPIVSNGAVFMESLPRLQEG